MKTTKLYTYLGTNGTITSPIHLENIYSVVKYKLSPKEGYKLTKDGIEFYNTVTIGEDEISEWYEVIEK